VLAHLARNADALVNVLAGRPMYANAEVRNAEIERDAPRPLADQLDDVRDSAARLQDAGAAPADWSRTVTLRNGVTDTASQIPFRRLVEVELHHVDLGCGYPLEALPEEFTERAIGYLTARFDGHPEIPAITLTADDGRSWSTGGDAGDPVAIGGPAADLLGWLSGRRDGATLEVGGGHLPALPAL
jgi:maleylpyruvate isomerase